MKSLKKFILCIPISVVMVVSFMPLNAWADDILPEEAAAYAVTAESCGITVGTNNGNASTDSDGMIHITENGDYDITGTCSHTNGVTGESDASKKSLIKVDENLENVSLTLSGVAITCNDYTAPLAISANSTVTLTASDDRLNKVKAGLHCAGINVEYGAKLIINLGEAGKLEACGGKWAAGIDANAKSKFGSIEICSGTVYAKGSGTAANIGGGFEGNLDGSSIIISGGTVYANERTDNDTGGAGIGGGYLGLGNTTINISGGTVYSKGAIEGAGIGIGLNYRCINNTRINITMISLSVRMSLLC